MPVVTSFPFFSLCLLQDCLQPLSMQALPAQPESLCIVEMGGTEKQDELGERGSIGFLYLNIGLQVSGELAGHKCKFPPAFPDPRLGRRQHIPPDFAWDKLYSSPSTRRASSANFWVKRWSFLQKLPVGQDIKGSDCPQPQALL